jgi:hypothetical protein
MVWESKVYSEYVQKVKSYQICISYALQPEDQDIHASIIEFILTRMFLCQ